MSTRKKRRTNHGNNTKEPLCENPRSIRGFRFVGDEEHWNNTQNFITKEIILGYRDYRAAESGVLRERIPPVAIEGFQSIWIGHAYFHAPCLREGVRDALNIIEYGDLTIHDVQLDTQGALDWTANEVRECPMVRADNGNDWKKECAFYEVAKGFYDKETMFDIKDNYFISDLKDVSPKPLPLDNDVRCKLDLRNMESGSVVNLADYFTPKTKGEGYLTVYNFGIGCNGDVTLVVPDSLLDFELELINCHCFIDASSKMKGDRLYVNGAYEYSIINKDGID